MKKLTIFLLLANFVLQNSLSQSGCLYGCILRKSDSSIVAGAYIIMNVVNKTLITDKDGVFRICDLSPGEYSFGILLLGFKDTTISNLKISAYKSVNVKVYLSECEYHILGKPNICPICGKSDMVIPILYETASKKMIKRSKQGKVYLGGHRTGCDPTYFCKRDSIKF